MFNKIQAKKAIEQFLIEDIGTGDISNIIFDKERTGTGVFLAKSSGIFAGMDIISLVYEVYGADVSIKLYKNDGGRLEKGDYIAEVEGDVASLLSCERIILNLMQRMSGIATAANNAVKALNDDTMKIVDTRKTLPGLRMFEKYAVTCGGAYNHRMGLYDAVMLKDNHIAFAGSIADAVRGIKEKLGHTVKVEVETESEEQVKEAVSAGADIIMFDNRTPQQVRELVKLVPKNIITEISGGITIDNIGSYAHTGADVISMGSITHSAVPLDISFNSTEGNKL